MSVNAHGTQANLQSNVMKGIGLADHFVACSRIGRYLTFQANGRFIITDDFSTGKLSIPKDAHAVAAICSKDDLVARAALVPLARRAASMDDVRRESFEELFELIETQSLSPKVRAGAAAVLQSGFREARIRELEALLGDDLNPARARYRKFLEVVRQMIEGRVSSGTFIDDFVDFTHSVAGRLDFGIYSYCLDRIFSTQLIPLQVKKLVTIEVLKFPSLVRRELISSALSNKGVDRQAQDFIRHAVSLHLDKNQALEIELLQAVKEQRISVQEIEKSLSHATTAASYSGVSGQA
ncbi:MAG: hypothetical protein JKY27_12545 [Magnetovibrio sp.]|nr:hypothetical protein [Magnetovibrio sp.]